MIQYISWKGRGTMPVLKTERQRKQGLIEIKRIVGRKVDGTAISKSFYGSTKREAERKFEEYKREVASGAVTPLNAPFDKYAQRWAEVYKKPLVKPHTYLWTYMTNIDNYFIPYFKDKQLQHITSEDVQSYFNSHTYLSYTVLKRQHGILCAIFDRAVYDGYCVKTPMYGITYVSDKKRVKKGFYTLSQATELSEYLKKVLQRNPKSLDELFEALMIYITLNTGLRRGEMLGLKVSDFDWKGKYVRVRRAVSNDTVGEPEDGEVKTYDSIRNIPIADDVVAVLKKRLKDWPSKYVLYDMENHSVNTISWFDYHYKQALEKYSTLVNVPYMTPHELRHSFGSVLYERGVDIYAISKAMGHANVTITSSIYVKTTTQNLRDKMKY